jgi:inulin fructotransferase (DFA-I-forming)
VLRDVEPWTPFLEVDNGRDDLFGLLRIGGDHNSVIGNHFSEVVDSAAIRPEGATPVVIRLLSGVGNYVATNHIVALDVRSAPQDSAYAAQVEALLTTAARAVLPVTTVHVDAGSSANTILDSGTRAEVVADAALNAVRLSPTVGSFA